MDCFFTFETAVVCTQTFCASDVLYVPPGLTFRNSLFSPHYICVMRVSVDKKLLFLYTTLTYLFFFIIAEARCTSCAVGTGSSNQTDTVSSLKWLMYQGFTYMYITDWMRYILYENWLYVVRTKLKEKKT